MKFTSNHYMSNSTAIHFLENIPTMTWPSMKWISLSCLFSPKIRFGSTYFLLIHFLFYFGASLIGGNGGVKFGRENHHHNAYLGKWYYQQNQPLKGLMWNIEGKLRLEYDPNNISPMKMKVLMSKDKGIQMLDEHWEVENGKQLL